MVSSEAVVDATLLVQDWRREEDKRKPGFFVLTPEAHASLINRVAEAMDNFRAEPMRALESLTPGGSEFVGDIERCVVYVRDQRSAMLRNHVEVIKREKAVAQREKVVIQKEEQLRGESSL